MKVFISIIAVFVFLRGEGQTVREERDYYESGKLYSIGHFKQIDSISENSFGLWTYWYENSQKKSEEIQSDIITRYINFWTSNGIQTLNNGNGILQEEAQYTGDDSSIFIIKDSLKNGQYFSYIPY